MRAVIRFWSAVMVLAMFAACGGGLGDNDHSGGGQQDFWLPTSVTNAPAERWDSTAVWTGSKMIVWGGSDVSGLLTSGGVYDPVADTWTPMTETDAPVARELFPAVWTGTEMIVWGGYYFDVVDDYSNKGGVYNPAMNIWAGTTTTNSPHGRRSHSAVWTGSKMIVWGGLYYDPGLIYANSGGVYDPVTDTWTDTSLTNAPSARIDHTAVWTGAKMIVWGGFFYDTAEHYINDGAGYDPAGNSWTALSGTNAPIGRTEHSAVWTGTQMIVWGGNYYDLVTINLNSGGVYDPGLDSWKPTSLTNAPEAAYRKTAVWAGNLMIVWGGYSESGSAPVATGARYDPVTDSWSATTTVAAPAARDFHSAVSTGTGMIVWGGLDASNLPLNTGGRYFP